MNADPVTRNVDLDLELFCSLGIRSKLKICRISTASRPEAVEERTVERMVVPQ